MWLLVLANNWYTIGGTPCGKYSVVCSSSLCVYSPQYIHIEIIRTFLKFTASRRERERIKIILIKRSTSTKIGVKGRVHRETNSAGENLITSPENFRKYKLFKCRTSVQCTASTSVSHGSINKWKLHEVYSFLPELRLRGKTTNISITSIWQANDWFNCR